MPEGFDRESLYTWSTPDIEARYQVFLRLEQTRNNLIAKLLELGVPQAELTIDGKILCRVTTNQEDINRLTVLFVNKQKELNALLKKIGNPLEPTMVTLVNFDPEDAGYRIGDAPAGNFPLCDDIASIERVRGHHEQGLFCGWDTIDDYLEIQEGWKAL